MKGIILLLACLVLASAVKASEMTYEGKSFVVVYLIFYGQNWKEILRKVCDWKRFIEYSEF